MKDHFEELIQTIERNAVDNKATITNVFLWAESWRAEREMDIQNELERIKKEYKESPYLRYSPLQEFILNEKELEKKDGPIFEHPIPHAVDPELASKLYRENQHTPPANHFMCVGNNCALSSTVGEKILGCEQRGCQMKSNI